jgi:glycosyltransferase involved in cell wall biosynthesis
MSAVRRAERTRLLYVLAQPTRWPAFEWISHEIDRDRFDLSFLLLHDGPSPMAPYLAACGVPFKAIQYRSKRDVARAARAVARHCHEHRIDIVHTHFMNACLAGLSGARLAGVQPRLHTRHHAGPYPWSHRPPWGRLYDRYNNGLSRRIVAPSREVWKTLVHRDGVPSQKIALIPHGFDLAAWRRVPEERVRRLRQRYNPRGASPVIGVVARFEEIKGVHYVVEAFHRLLAEHPSALLVLANARGRYQPIRELLSRLPPDRHVEIPFEEDAFALYHLFDVFVHVPVAPEVEAFGQVYVEAMAAGLPCIFTRAGIADELVRHGENAWVVEHRDGEGIYQGLRALLANPELRQRLGREACRSLGRTFEVRTMVRSLEDLYASMLGEVRNA